MEQVNNTEGRAVKVVRILHMSDTHNLLQKEMVAEMPEADVLIHTGDFSETGTPQEFAAFNEVLAEMRPKYKEIVVLIGNHDVRKARDNFGMVTSHLTNATHIPIHDKFTLQCGLRLYGAPWYFGHNWKYILKNTRNHTHEGARFADIPIGREEIDILLTHGPPYGILDEARGIKGNLTGSPQLLEVLKKSRPPLHLWGHTHEQNGSTLLRWKAKGGEDVISSSASEGEYEYEYEEESTHEGIGGTLQQCTLCINSAMRSRGGRVRLASPAHLIIGSLQEDGHWTFSIETKVEVK